MIIDGFIVSGAVVVNTPTGSFTVLHVSKEEQAPNINQDGEGFVQLGARSTRRSRAPSIPAPNETQCIDDFDVGTDMSVEPPGEGI